jgi:hypothetical protein
VYRRLLKMTLDHLQILEQQIGQLDQELATLLHPYRDAVQRLAEVPDFGVDSAQQIIAEVGVAFFAGEFVRNVHVGQSSHTWWSVRRRRRCSGISAGILEVLLVKRNITIWGSYSTFGREREAEGISRCQSLLTWLAGTLKNSCPPGWIRVSSWTPGS